jgi:tetratricopeptide (TPR) repeat protein
MKNGLNIIIAFVFLLLTCCDQKQKEKENANRFNTDPLFMEASFKLESGNYRESIVLYDSIIQIDSTLAKAYFKRAYCEAQIDSMDSSIKDYKKSIDLGYNKATAYYSLGLVETALHKDSAAIKYFQESLKNDPGKVIADSCIEFCKARIIYDNNLKK